MSSEPGLRSAAIALIAGSWVSALGPSAWAESGRGECVMLQALDRSASFVSDPSECSVKTAPASTFKIPHALIALETGVVPDAFELVKWDGSSKPFPAWERDHSLDSAMKSSVVWFFQRTAVSIGPDRLLEYLRKLGYAEDTFERDVTSFWLNGDLLVSPEEQLSFLRRLVQYELPVRREHVDAVMASFLMPSGRITNATGVHPFALDWPSGAVVRAKTGNTTVGKERVSWLVGHIETNGREYVFVSRVRAEESLRGTEGADLALSVLNSHRPESTRR